VCLGSQEFGPRGSHAGRCWFDAGGLPDVPDGGGADLVAETGELAVDPSIPHVGCQLEVVEALAPQRADEAFRDRIRAALEPGCG